MKLGLRICKTDVSAQKIDGSGLETFDRIITFFLVHAKNGKFCCFEEPFLLVDISIDIVFERLFYTLNNVEINFTD